MAIGEDQPEAVLPEAGPPAEFDDYTIVLLLRPPDAPDLAQDELDKLQRQHLGHLETLRQKGVLLANGPFLEQPDQSWRGLAIYGVGVEEARRLAEADPSVKRGRLKIIAFRWLTRKGALLSASAAPPSKA